MKKMTIRICFFFVLWIGQLLVYISIYEVGYALWKYLGNEIRNNIGWGITIHFSFYVFAVLSFINSILLVGRIKKGWLIAFVLFVIFEVLFARGFMHTPLRSLLLSFSVFSVLLVPHLIRGFIQKKKYRSNDENRIIDND